MKKSRNPIATAMAVATVVAVYGGTKKMTKYGKGQTGHKLHLPHPFKKVPGDFDMFRSRR